MQHTGSLIVEKVKFQRAQGGCRKGERRRRTCEALVQVKRVRDLMATSVSTSLLASVCVQEAEKPCACLRLGPWLGRQLTVWVVECLSRNIEY